MRLSLRQRPAPAAAYAFRACATVTGQLLCRLTAGHTEAQIVVAVRRDAAAARRPAVARVAPPAAAAKHVAGAPFGANRIGAARKFSVVPIRAPLKHAAVHVEQAPRVWLLQANCVAVVGMVLLCGIAQGAEPKSVTNLIGMELIEIPAGKFVMGKESRAVGAGLLEGKILT